VIGVALYEPEIPANAGNIARLCAATGAPLHLIGRLGFSFRHPEARRAGMDYWKDVVVQRHLCYADFHEHAGGAAVWMLSTRGERLHWDAPYSAGDLLLFGPESRGLPDDLLRVDPERVLRIPMLTHARSLNLATSAGIALYEALRQVGWKPTMTRPEAQ
jgi:tRNA (cytidine/uridine-2'-O-)-methyltransferase